MHNRTKWLFGVIAVSALLAPMTAVGQDSYADYVAVERADGNTPKGLNIQLASDAHVPSPTPPVQTPRTSAYVPLPTTSYTSPRRVAQTTAKQATPVVEAEYYPTTSTSQVNQLVAMSMGQKGNRVSCTALSGYVWTHSGPNTFDTSRTGKVGPNISGTIVTGNRGEKYVRIRNGQFVVIRKGVTSCRKVGSSQGRMSRLEVVFKNILMAPARLARADRVLARTGEKQAFLAELCWEHRREFGWKGCFAEARKVRGATADLMSKSSPASRRNIARQYMLAFLRQNPLLETQRRLDVIIDKDVKGVPNGYPKLNKLKATAERYADGRTNSRLSHFFISHIELKLAAERLKDQDRWFNQTVKVYGPAFAKCNPQSNKNNEAVCLTASSLFDSWRDKMHDRLPEKNSRFTHDQKTTPAALYGLYVKAIRQQASWSQATYVAKLGKKELTAPAKQFASSVMAGNHQQAKLAKRVCKGESSDCYANMNVLGLYPLVQRPASLVALATAKSCKVSTEQNFASCTSKVRDEYNREKSRRYSHLGVDDSVQDSSALELKWEYLALLGMLVLAWIMRQQLVFAVYGILGFASKSSQLKSPKSQNSTVSSTDRFKL